MEINIAILVGLAVNVVLNWLSLRNTGQLEEVVIKMLMDLGKKGILEVEVEDA